jgi:predicted DCC family thiol-disulfide oxidoreductase YuxK
MAREPYSYRSDPAVPPFPDDRPIIIFDGKCVLCSRFAQFVMRVDKNRRFRLLAAQQPIGTALYAHFGLDPETYETFILLDGGRASVRSEAALQIFSKLGFPWSLSAAARIMPRAVRDPLYDFIARNRLRWFGSRSVCYMPDASEADRFIA